jgi:diguanylate cyclase (GGDEF)-like protein
MKPVLIACGFLLLHGLAVLLLPAHAKPVSWGFMVLAPSAAVAVALWRCRQDSFRPSHGWSTEALAIVFWTLSALAWACRDLSGNTESPLPLSMFFYVMRGVPLAWMISHAWKGSESTVVRIIDFVLVTTLGLLYFGFVFSDKTLEGGSNATPPVRFALAAGAMNLFIFSGMLVRYLIAESANERNFFGVSAAYALAQAVVTAFNSQRTWHIGGPSDLLATVPFLLFCVLAWRLPPTHAPVRTPRLQHARYVHGGKSLMLPLSLLVVSLILIRENYSLGLAGILVALLGHGLRSTVSEVRHAETAAVLLKDRSTLEVLAWNDGLTGVSNRRAFDIAFDREWRRAVRAQQELAVVMVDIDYFKRLNDRYGHPFGDACLRRVAEALSTVAKRPGDFLARYGGEEFVLLLSDTDEGGALHVAEQLRRAVHALRIGNSESPFGVVTVSIGIAAAVPRATEESGAAILAAADAALYQAKQLGRNRVAVPPEAVGDERDALLMRSTMPAELS